MQKITFSCGEITINSHSTKAVYFDFILNLRQLENLKFILKKIEITYLGEKKFHMKYFMVKIK